MRNSHPATHFFIFLFNFSFFISHFSFIFRTFAAVTRKNEKTFRPMNTRTRRHIASWLLLAVFVPMLVLSSVHVHPATPLDADECAECLTHHCGGHIGQHAVAFHACVLCQFLTLSFPAAAVAASAVIYNKVLRSPRQPGRLRLAQAACGIVGLRAPPVLA